MKESISGAEPLPNMWCPGFGCQNHRKKMYYISGKNPENRGRDGEIIEDRGEMNASTPVLYFFSLSKGERSFTWVE